MLFNSIEFIFVFLPIVLAGQALLARRDHRFAQLWLILTSIFFYGWWNPAHVWLLATSILVNYTLGRALASSARSPRGRRLTLTLGIVFNLGLLAYFKYAAFIVQQVVTVTGLPLAIPHIALPIAISFITFQKIAYLVDAYHSPAEFRYSFLDFALFVTYFPQLIAGPIARHKDIFPQIKQHRRLSTWDIRLAVGVSVFLIALFKKCVIADNLAALANPIFSIAESNDAPAGSAAWLAALAYSLQLYFDFSAYSEMACGLGILLGIKLPQNFNSPYKADSIIDFWRRWHMSLSRFLRDYLFIPLGGNRCSRARHFANVVITMTLGGLWHGAGWTFVAWGLFHGMLIVVNHLWRAIRTLPTVGSTMPGYVLGRAATFLVVVFGWVLFRAESFRGAAVMLRAMVGAGPAATAAHEIPEGAWLAVLVLVVAAMTLPNVFDLFGAHLQLFESGPAKHADAEAPTPSLRWQPSLAWAVTVALAGVAAFFSMIVLRVHNEFIYFQF